VGDIAVLALAEIVVPEIYAAVRFGALFIVSAHAQFQGERIGLLIAALAIGTLIPITMLNDDTPVSGDLLLFYELLWAALLLAAALIVGTARSSESVGRLRAREATRRTIEAETQARRKLSEAIHDGPIQELVSLSMMLSAAQKAVHRGDAALAEPAIEEARKIAERNVRTLRDEIVSLGPYAFEEVSLQAALEGCVDAWERRFDIDVKLEAESDAQLSPHLNGALFQIAQEAVTNAGRHADADHVLVSLRSIDGAVEMVIEDDGKGFDQDPLGDRQPGHIGLAAMRERVHLVDGRLEIRSGANGTRVRVVVPNRD
jgi:two-component system NarL family sensor kinase